MGEQASSRGLVDRHLSFLSSCQFFTTQSCPYPRLWRTSARRPFFACSSKNLLPCRSLPQTASPRTMVGGVSEVHAGPPYFSRKHLVHDSLHRRQHDAASIDMIKSFIAPLRLQPKASEPSSTIPIFSEQSGVFGGGIGTECCKC